MKRIFTLSFFIFLAMFCLQTFATENQHNSDSAGYSGSVAGKTTIINHDMIERFKSVENTNEFLSWSQLIQGYDFKSIQEFYTAYLNSNLSNESLSEIKLVLEEEYKIRVGYSNEISEEEIEWFVEIKEKINKQLRENNMLVEK